MRNAFRLAATLMGATILTACSGGGESEAPPAPVNDTVVTNDAPIGNDAMAIDNLTDTNATPAPAPTPSATATTAAINDPATQGATDSQMQDDADATGMTARVNRGGDGNESAPAE